MLYIYVPGEGWVLRPSPVAPIGCVFAPGTRRSFGFSRAWCRALGVACGGLLAVLYVAGHEIEVVTAVLAGAFTAALADLTHAAVKQMWARDAIRSPKSGAR